MADKSRDNLRSCSTTRRAYTLEFKLDVLKWMKKNSGSTRGTAKRFGIHRRMVQKWKENEPELAKAFVANGAKRMKIRQQKQPLFQELEERMLHWFMGQRQSQPSDSSIKTYALSIAREIGLDNFKASSAWILSFKERHNNVGTLLSNNSTRTSLSGNELLSTTHTPLNEPHILLHFTEGGASIHSSNRETFVYYDYQTPEHNYCTVTPIYSSDNYKMEDKRDTKEQVRKFNTLMSRQTRTLLCAS